MEQELSTVPKTPNNKFDLTNQGSAFIRKRLSFVVGLSLAFVNHPTGFAGQLNVMSMLYQITSYLDTPREEEKEWHCKGILLLKQTEKQ